VDLKDIFLDLGIKGEDKIKALGIQIGDMVTPYIEFQQMADNKVWLAKAWDNRIGCAIVADVAANLAKSKTPNQAYFVATVQEEVGFTRRENERQ
jgi:Cellulase M and related proteins